MSELSIVARAINALSAFGVTTEREAGQLLPMWLHFSEMTAGDRTAVYRHYRTEIAPTTEPANPDRRCHRCGATSGLKMLHRNPLTLADREWECYDGCTGGVR